MPYARPLSGRAWLLGFGFRFDGEVVDVGEGFHACGTEFSLCPFCRSLHLLCGRDVSGRPFRYGVGRAAFDFPFKWFEISVGVAPRSFAFRIDDKGDNKEDGRADNEYHDIRDRAACIDLRRRNKAQDHGYECSKQAYARDEPFPEVAAGDAEAAFDVGLRLAETQECEIDDEDHCQIDDGRHLAKNLIG